MSLPVSAELWNTNIGVTIAKDGRSIQLENGPIQDRLINYIELTQLRK